LSGAERGYRSPMGRPSVSPPMKSKTRMVNLFAKPMLPYL
jgi:hypothetical protein